MLVSVVAHETFIDVAQLLVPELQRRCRYKQHYTAGTLREKLFGGAPTLPASHPAAGYRWGLPNSTLRTPAGQRSGSKP